MRWAIIDVRENKNVKEYRTFHEGMEELKNVSGEWGAYWSLECIVKGHFRLERVE